MKVTDLFENILITKRKPLSLKESNDDHYQYGAWVYDNKFISVNNQEHYEIADQILNKNKEQNPLDDNRSEHNVYYTAFKKDWIRIIWTQFNYPKTIWLECTINGLQKNYKPLLPWFAKATRILIEIVDLQRNVLYNLDIDFTTKQEFLEKLRNNEVRSLFRKETVTEEVEYIKSTRNSGDTEILINPSRRDIDSKEVRFILDTMTDNLYVWAAHEMLHDEIVAAMGLMEETIIGGIFDFRKKKMNFDGATYASNEDKDYIKQSENVERAFGFFEI